MCSIEFSKLSGSGNDFICINNLDGRFDDILKNRDRSARFAHALCRRGLGVGADGIVFAGKCELDDLADVGATFLESDGSKTFLCGNGTACFAHWAAVERIVPRGEIRILTSAGVVRAQDIEDSYVRVCLPLPEDIRTDLELRVDDRPLKCDYAVTGIEHLVLYVDDIDKAPVARLGPALRNHEHFPQPRGVNVNFVQVLGEGELAVRTYEYGVEAETLACGTGSAAAAILSTKRFNWPEPYVSGLKPVRIHARSGDVLRVRFKIDGDGKVHDPCLETVVRCTYTATLCGDLTELALKEGADKP